jgi:hypothetical protein
MCVVNFEGSSPSNNAKKFGDALDLARIIFSTSRPRLRARAAAPPCAGDGPALALRHSSGRSGPRRPRTEFGRSLVLQLLPRPLTTASLFCLSERKLRMCRVNVTAMLRLHRQAPRCLIVCVAVIALSGSVFLRSAAKHNVIHCDVAQRGVFIGYLVLDVLPSFGFFNFLSCGG